MSKDGLTRLGDQVVANLLRALMQVRHEPNSRLILTPPANQRAPVWSALKSDYDVWYRGEIVGRIWRHTYNGELHQGFAWHWHMTAKDRKQENGHVLTRHEAMEEFRAAWDLNPPDAITG